MLIEDLLQAVGNFTMNTGFLSNCELQRPPPVRSPVRTREVAGYYKYGCSVKVMTVTLAMREIEAQFTAAAQARGGALSRGRG
jgi:hypothetical protein